ncbi:LicD family protein [Bacillus pumilus]|nr:LicD family protein [Bacillus pumilus]
MAKLALILFLVIIGIASFGGYYLFSDQGYYKTNDYYIYNTEDPKIKHETNDQGESNKYYIYEVSGYKDGKSENLKLSLLSPIKKNQAYLVKWEERRAIVSKIKEISNSKFEKNKNP